MIKFSKEELEQMVPVIQVYFREELDQELGGFDAQFLIDFFAEKMGSHFYNKALSDVQTLLENKLEDFGNSLLELEKPLT